MVLQENTCHLQKRVKKLFLEDGILKKLKEILYFFPSRNASWYRMGKYNEYYP